MKLKLLRVVSRGGDVKEFVFQPPQGFAWEAGQYMHYVLPHEADDRGIERWFTISAAPSEGEVRITTRINHEHSSSFKQQLQALRPGDEIDADGPEGDFTLQDPARNYLFVVGGIGITPIRSMLTEAAAKGLQLNASLLYANRSEQDIPFRDELEAIRAANPNLKIEYVIEPDRLDEARLRAAIQAIENPLIYISGPEPMVKSLAEQIKAMGVAEENIKLDDFPGYERI